jgi:hypothetical protein
MARPSLADFKKPDGRIDWDGLKAAEIANGDVCYACNAAILFGGKGYRDRCNACKSLDTNHGEVEHRKTIRCPKCRYTTSTIAYEIDLTKVFFGGEEGIDVTCHECNTDFRIGVRVEIHFSSPALQPSSGN